MQEIPFCFLFGCIPHWKTHRHESSSRHPNRTDSEMRMMSFPSCYRIVFPSFLTYSCVQNWEKMFKWSHLSLYFRPATFEMSSDSPRLPLFNGAAPIKIQALAVEKSEETPFLKFRTTETFLDFRTAGFQLWECYLFNDTGPTFQLPARVEIWRVRARVFSGKTPN